MTRMYWHLPLYIELKTQIVIYFTVLHLANLVLNLAFAARMQAKKFPVIDGLSVKTTNQYAVCYGPKPVIGLTTAASFITIAVSLCAILELKMEGKLVRPMKNLFRFRMLIYFCLSFVAFSVSIYYADCMRTDYLNWPVYDDERRVAKAALALACVGVFETLVQLGLTVVDKLYNKEIS